MAKTKSIFKSNPPAVARYVIYAAAGMVLVLGILLLMSVESMVDGYFDESVVGSSYGSSLE